MPLEVLNMVSKIVPITDLRRQASSLIENVIAEGNVVYITQHGRPTAVLLDYEQYEAMQAQLAGEAAAPPSKTILEALAEMAEDLGIEDLAEQHDHYLYGVDKT
jgi:prevent-host-death family protein